MLSTSLLGNTAWDIMSSWDNLILTDGRVKSTDNHYSETDDGFTCEINVAGIKKDNIKVLLENRRLQISAEQDGHKYRTSLLVPRKVDPDSVSVRYEDGMLYLDLKKEGKHKPVELKIE